LVIQYSPYYLPAIYILNIHSISSVTKQTVKCEEQTEVVEPKHAKKPTKELRPIKEAPLITAEEFESVPR